jgi:threonine--tRNA ligase
MKITLKDGSVIEREKGISCFDVAKSISEGLARAAVGAVVGDKKVDLSYVLNDDCALSVLTARDEAGLEIYRHSAAHIMAQAVKRLYKDVKFAIGPAVSNGFYYDIEFSKPVGKEDLDAIEKEMAAIVKEDLPFVRKEVSRSEALEFMRAKGEVYKVELIEELPEDAVITFYTQGEFTDLCRGPHVPTTGKIKNFKLTQITGAYFKGDEKNKMLTRIYGTAFEKKAELDDYLKALEEAKLRDHNKIGRDLGYFMTSDVIGQGLPLLMPKGARLFQILNRFVEDEERRRGYVLTKTPYMAKSELYKISGHWDHYKDGMFVMGDEEKDEEVYALRPMTCPFQYTVYNNGLKSYRDLPLRYGETSTLFRNEASGEMHGLIRVRQFTLSEGHLICMPSQLEKEFLGCLDLAMFMLKSLGLDGDVSYRFSKWDPENKEKYIDDPEEWAYAEGEMKRILDHIGLDYSVGIGEAAFYGPKLDIQIKNVHGKEDTLITIQIDMFLAERFDMNYIDENGNKARPYIIHRSSIGCYERTIALLLEKYAGALPLWLSPTQIRVLSLTDRTAGEAEAVAAKLEAAGLRAETDLRNEKIGYKIREAQLEKIPYMLIIGDKDVENKVVSVRSRKDGDLGAMSFEAFLSKVKEENDNKVLN